MVGTDERRHDRHWWLVRCVAALLAVGCLLAGIPRLMAAVDVSDGSHVTQMVSHAEVALLPMIGGGEGGWCVTAVGSIGCSSADARVFGDPVIIETWSSASYSTGNEQSHDAVDEGIVVTGGEVSDVSLEGGSPISTDAGRSLPNHMRAAVVELRGTPKRKILGFTVPPPLPRAHFVAWNSKGQVVRRTSAPGPSLTFSVPSRKWGRGSRADEGVCSLKASGVAGLVSEGGSVMVAVKPHRDVRGREFVDCVRTEYVMQGWPLEADILLDAAHPGIVPGPLPLTDTLPGHAGVWQGPGVQGATVARRIEGAWLVVGGGQNLDQRVMLLEHLRPTIHL